MPLAKLILGLRWYPLAPIKMMFYTRKLAAFTIFYHLFEKFGVSLIVFKSRKKLDLPRIDVGAYPTCGKQRSLSIGQRFAAVFRLKYGRSGIGRSAIFWARPPMLRLSSQPKRWTKKGNVVPHKYQSSQT